MKKRTRRITALVLCGVAVLILVFGIREYRRRHYNYIDLPIVLGNEEEIVGVVRDGLTTHNRQITISFTAQGDYSSLITALADALVKKALEPTKDPKQGDYIRFQYGGYHVRYSTTPLESGGNRYLIKIQPDYYTTTAKEESVDEVVQNFLTETDFKWNTTDYEKIKAAHDFIADRCEYDWRNSQLEHRHIKSTAYGALISGEASCQGYSVALYRLLREAGVNCRIITGYATSPETGETEYHAWNLVYLDGKWYNVDLSWDDQTESYDYFLKSDASFSTHVRESEYDAEEFRAEYPVSAEDWEK